MKRRDGKWVLALMAVAGCAQPGGGAVGDATVPIAMLVSQDPCGTLNHPGVRWITNAGEWRDVYAQVNSAWMPLPSPPTVDFPRIGVLLIAMGQRPTAGYGLALADEVATVRDGVLTVRVRWREPPPGRRQAQVMTSPCLLATVPDAGFTRIRVVDQNGGVRLEGAR